MNKKLISYQRVYARIEGLKEEHFQWNSGGWSSIICYENKTDRCRKSLIWEEPQLTPLFLLEIDKTNNKYKFEIILQQLKTTQFPSTLAHPQKIATSSL